jgi:CubicO group peptidase (beta-lactamase class C family)
VTLSIDGTCDPRFSRVKDAFAETFRSELALGAAIAVTLDGEPVVDLWGGWRDGKRAAFWEKDTLVNVFSTTKGFTAMCAHRLVDSGQLDFDARVADLWPEFAQAGKDDVRVGWLLDHRAGLPAVRAPLPGEALFDWDVMTGALAAEAPWWKPGTSHGYHAVTYGWLVGEVIRRASGKTPGVYFRDEIARPLGLDAHIGLAPEDDARCAELRAGPRPTAAEPTPTLFDRILAEPQSMTAKAFANPVTMITPGVVNSRAWRGAELPSVNGHTTARAIARLYGALARGGEVDGVRVLSRESIARCSTERAFGMDAVLGVKTRFGLGFMLPHDGARFGPSDASFGHPGAGGSLGFADPDARIGFGFVVSRMGSSILIDPRAASLIDALYAAI